VGRGRPARGRDALLLVLVILLLWQALFHLAGTSALTGPADTALLAARLLGTATFWPHLRETAAAFLGALAIAVVAGLAAGLALGGHRLSGEVAEPVLVALYSIPKVTLYPVVLLFFGIGLPARVVFGAIHGVVPIAVFAMNAIRGIDPIHVKTARVLRLGPWRTARRVLLPAALPEVFTGLRVGFSLTLVGTLIGEMFGSQRGLGYVLMTAIGLHRMDTIMAVTLLLVVFATAVNAALLLLDARLHRRV
jgi:NitT/TauT family transport system permease protein